jgi:hypothetical protein
MTPSHVKEGTHKLKPAAFRSKAGIDEVSVIRQTYMGSDFCKAKAQEIATRNEKVMWGWPCSPQGTSANAALRSKTHETNTAVTRISRMASFSNRMSRPTPPLIWH